MESGKDCGLPTLTMVVLDEKSCYQLIIYSFIFLPFPFRKQSDAPLLIELFRLCHSTAGQMHMVGEKNKAVRALARGFMNVSQDTSLRLCLTSIL